MEDENGYYTEEMAKYLAKKLGLYACEGINGWWIE